VAVLRQLRSLLAVVLTLLVFLPGSIVQRVLVWPVAVLVPSRRLAIVAWYMRGMSSSLLGALSLGGARFERRGKIATSAPCLVLMNHQSLLDILNAVLLSDPYVPAFVTRRRYARFIPAVSLCLRLQGAPIIDPEAARKHALNAIADAGRNRPQGLLLFPEGHRSRDGEIQPFKTAGALAVLRARRLPVYAVVTDGVWIVRRLVDMVFGVDRIRCRTEVLGPFTAPENDRQLSEFLTEIRERMVDHLREMRGRP
jgi:1-acyl-sn-glycerol-3-phosphate acyltransferase